MEKVQDKFLRYVGVWTTSDPESAEAPSTKRQFDLINMLSDELKAMGIKTKVSPKAVLMATIPSNVKTKKGEKPLPAIGFIAHVDTAPDAEGKDIKPQIIPDYNGKDIILNKAKKVKLSTALFPELKNFKGQTLITTDGTTLLGADDKAGVAEIMCAAEYMVNHPEFKHGTIKIAFTPDEEVGRGVENFSVKDFGADFAYTMDGGDVGELEFENFNAASAKIHIQGCNVHPGYAKGKMRNALHIAQELNDLLPADQRPERTEGYEGFFHLISLKGAVEEADMAYIIRDHDRAKFEEKKAVMQRAADTINARYGAGTATAVIKDQYYNMREQVEPHYRIIEIAQKAIKDAGVEPKVQPIRGGTDGANLSFRGLPCPNIFAGGLNFHGKFEWVPLESMEKASQVILNILSEFSSR